MIKINLEMEAKDLTELLERGINLDCDFEKSYQENEAREIRKRVVGADKLDETYEEMQARIRREIEQQTEAINELNKVKEIKIDDLCTHKSGIRTSSLEETTEGARCKICNKRFKLVSEEDEKNKDAIIHVNNIIESIKAYNLDITEYELIELAKFQSILNTLEDRLQRASKVLERYDSYPSQPMIDPNHPLAAINNTIFGSQLMPRI